MEEKKVTKINLSTFFLILAIILIIVMGIFIFKLYTEKTELTENSIKQEEKMSGLQNNVDRLTSELNEISSSINTNNTTNNISSTTTKTEEKHSNIEHDLSSYIGLWGKSSSNDYLYVYSINNNEITFDFIYNGKNIGEPHIEAILNGNTASFVIKDGNNSLNSKITLENNRVILNIIDSTFDNIAKGTITFSDYLGLQN